MSPAFFTPEMECYSVLILHFFRKVLPRPMGKPRGERGGERWVFAFHFPTSSCEPPARCRFLLGGLSEKHSSQPPGKRGGFYARTFRCEAFASGQVKSYFGTWADSRAKTIFAILI